MEKVAPLVNKGDGAGKVPGPDLASFSSSATSTEISLSSCEDRLETGFDGRAIVGYGLDATPLEPSETLLEPLSTGRSSKKYLGNSLFKWSFEGFLRLEMLRRIATCVRRVG